MYNQMLQPQQTLYQADPAFAEHVRCAREKLLDVCRQASNRPVRVQLMNGQVYEGIMVQADDNHLYLRVSNPNARAFFNPYASAQSEVILPLVLYTLLVITLLY
ncbi:MAG: acetyl-CoA acetyltransferase [Paenibacillaceae bacterium]|nr:acetyl-CoA acetyltransferase [Paenibacillaceae bacterium]